MYAAKLVGGLAVLVLAGAGCTIPTKEDLQKKAQESFQKAAERGAEEFAKQRTGADVNVDFTNGGAVYTDPKTGKTFAVGQKVEIPADFPKDIPRYPGATPTSVSSDAVTKSSALFLTTPDARTTVQNGITEQATSLGWTKEGEVKTADNLILTFTRTEAQGTARLTVTLMPVNLQKGTSILILRKGP